MFIPTDTTFTLAFAQFPEGVEAPNRRDGENVTAPPEGHPIPLRPPSVNEPQMWKLVAGPDPEQESYAIVHVPSSPNPGTEELGFCSISAESGAPIILSSPTYYVLKPTKFTTPGGPLLVTIHPKGFSSDNDYVIPSDEGTLQVQTIQATTGTWPGWVITPVMI
ncbi:hypothetical protein RhiJN_23076 [Ceratobasidium sp. AG-Ba]|nr:hypothetical protein RhiJN_23076 [Ceratobasidium sp. AG-Ba]